MRAQERPFFRGRVWIDVWLTVNHALDNLAQEGHLGLRPGTAGIGIVAHNAVDLPGIEAVEPQRRPATLRRRGLCPTSCTA